MAARRAKPVQRSSFQGLQGNPDACHPRRGSACNMRDNKTGGDARLVFAGQTQRTAAMSPRFLGGAGGKIPPGPFFPTAFFGKKAVPRPGRPAAAQARPARGYPGEWRATTGRPYGVDGAWRLPPAAQMPAGE